MSPASTGRLLGSIVCQRGPPGPRQARVELYDLLGARHDLVRDRVGRRRRADEWPRDVMIEEDRAGQAHDAEHVG